MAKEEISVDIVWVAKDMITSYKLPVYFSSAGEILVWLNDYMTDFAKPKGRSKETNKNTFAARAQDLKAFATYLYKFKLHWKNLNDHYFQEFIENEIIKVKAWQAGNQYEQKDEPGANLNVNRKVHAVYDFYEWAQNERLISDLIGPRCPIDTLLSNDKASKGVIVQRNTPAQSSKPSKRARSILYRPLTLPVPYSSEICCSWPSYEPLDFVQNLLIH
jgi:hypothetical protein